MNNDQMNNDQLQEDLTEVLRVRRDKLAKLQEMGRDPFKVSRYDRTSNSTEIKGNFEEFEGKVVKIAGRIMSKRIQGKAGFIDIQDQNGRIQCYVRLDRIGEEEYSIFSTYDIGDIIGVEGEVFKKDGGTYVFVNAWTNLADTYNTGFVVLLDDTYYAASYNGTGAEDWYLLGAAEYEIATVDLLTGNLEAVKYATNKKYDTGYVYFTQGEFLAEEEGFFANNGANIVNAVNAAYLDSDTYVADVIDDVLGTDIYNTTKNSKGVQKNFVALESLVLAKAGEIKGSTANRQDKVDGITYRVIEIDEEGLVIDVNDKVGADADAAALAAYAKKNDYTKIPAFYIYNVEKETAVVYLVISEAEVTKTNAKETTPVKIWEFVDENNTVDATINASLVYTEKVVDDKVVEYTILGVKYAFDAKALSAQGVHAKLAEEGLCFGLADDHKNEEYKVTYRIVDVDGDNDVLTPVSGETIWKTIVDTEYCDGKDECLACNLVSGIYAVYNTPIKMEVTENADGLYFNLVDFDLCIKDANDTELFWNTLTSAYEVKDGKNVGLKLTAGTTRFSQVGFASEAKEILD